MTAEVTAAAERTADLSALIRTYLQNQGVRRASYHATELSVILRDAGHLADADLTADLALRCAELTMLRDTAMARWNRGRAAWRSARRRAATLTVERDRARDIAVALEGQVAAVRALADTYAREADLICPERVYDKADKAWRVAHVRRRAAGDIRAALDPDPADRGTGERP